MAEQQVEQSNGPVGQQPQGNPSDATGLDAAIQAELRAMESQGQAPDNGPSEEGEPDPDEQDPDADPDKDAAEQDDKDAKDAADDAPDPDAELVDHEFNGQQYKLPKEIAEGLMLKADHTRKTMELAEYGRSLMERDQQSQAVYQASGEFVAGRAQLQALDGQAAELWAEVQANPNMRMENSLRFGEIGTQLQLLQMQRGQLLGNLNQIQQQQEEYSTRVTHQGLHAARPWLESQGLDAPTQKSVAAYAINSGMLSPEAMDYINRGEIPGAMLLLDKARRWDELQSKKTAVVDKVRSAKPVRVIRPGSSSQGNSTPSTQQLGKRLASSGSMKDAEALELAHMARRERQQRR